MTKLYDNLAEGLNLSGALYEDLDDVEPKVDLIDAYLDIKRAREAAKTAADDAHREAYREALEGTPFGALRDQIAAERASGGKCAADNFADFRSEMEWRDDEALARYVASHVGVPLRDCLEEFHDDGFDGFESADRVWSAGCLPLDNDKVEDALLALRAAFLAHMSHKPADGANG